MTYTTKTSEVLYDYHINDEILARQTTFKDLGVTFDKKLSFSNHIENIVTNTYKTLGFIIRNSNDFANNNAIKLLYFSFIRSRLEYACLIWNPHYSVHTNNLESVQRRFLKYLSFKQDGAYPAIGFSQEALLNRFSLTSLESRRELFSVSFLHKLCHGKLDCAELVGSLNFHVPRPASRQEQCFYLPTPRTNILKYSPLYNICSYYNNRQNDLDIFV